MPDTILTALQILTPVIPKPPCEVGTIIIFIILIRKLKQNQVKKLSSGPTVSKWQCQAGWTPGPHPQPAA